MLQLRCVQARAPVGGPDGLRPHRGINRPAILTADGARPRPPSGEQRIALGAPLRAARRGRAPAPRPAGAGCRAPAGRVRICSRCRPRRACPSASRRSAGTRISTTARSWEMNRQANPISRCSSWNSSSTLRLHRDVERRRRLVGDQQLAARARAPGRCRRAGADRPTARAGSGCAGPARRCTRSSSVLDALARARHPWRPSAAAAARRSTRRSAGAG